jgi:hypothetical protein
MTQSLRLDPRLVLSGGLAVLAVPATSVALASTGLPIIASAVLTAVLAVALTAVGWRRLPESVSWPMPGRPVLLALWMVLVAAALTPNVRLAVFMHDAARADLSVLPARDFFRTHACLSAYTEASRLAPSGQNIYDPRAYEGRKLGRLDVDIFQYPPAFLLLGGTLRAASTDFMVTRASWFGLQTLALLAAALALALWIGGRPGAAAAWLIPVVLLSINTLITLQLGNFQVSAFAWSVGAMLMASLGWPIAAGAILGFCAAGKLFPGVLALYLAASRRWRPMLATAAWMLVWLLVAIAWYGMKPQWDFVLYQLPRIQSGEAFFWMDAPDAAAINNSIYGLVVRLRWLGVPLMTHAIGNTIASAYGAGVLALAVWAGWTTRCAARATPRARGAEAVVWLALLNLGSLRSPFVPDAYAYIGTIWLGTLLFARRERPGAGPAVLAVLLWVALMQVFDGQLPEGAVTPAWRIWTTLVIQLAAFGLNLAGLVGAVRELWRPEAVTVAEALADARASAAATAGAPGAPAVGA